MSDSILQSFLNNQFINTDDPEHIKNLKKASVVVQKKLSIKKNKEQIISYTLVALDPNIPDNNDVVKDVEDIIIKKWSTFRNSILKVKDSPLSYIQAVILDALDTLSKNEIYAGIIWHTGCNIISHYKLAGQQEILSSFLQNIGNKVEVVAQTDWSISDNTQLEAVNPASYSPPKIQSGAISEVRLKSLLLAASVHTGWKEQAGGGENPYTQAQNNVNWPKFFSERTAQGLTKEINTALSLQERSLNSITSSIQEHMEAYSGELQPYLEKVSSSIMKSSKSLNKRSNLIWWKQSLYSISLDKSYRSLKPLALAVALSKDLTDMVDPIYPKSVDYLLQETLRDIVGSDVDEEKDISQFIGKLDQLSEDESQLLEGLQIEVTDRIPLGSSIAGIINKTIDVEEFYEQTGIDKKAKLSLQELTVWLFHNLQAKKLLQLI